MEKGLALEIKSSMIRFPRANLDHFAWDHISESCEKNVQRSYRLQHGGVNTQLKVKNGGLLKQDPTLAKSAHRKHNQEIPREQNAIADALARLASSTITNMANLVRIHFLKEPSITIPKEFDRLDDNRT
uniref:Uncharacterized protein n=1 Tax=Cannabis sativa TaxID=3483 RepID=A0A803QGN4_CANSA